ALTAALAALCGLLHDTSLRIPDPPALLTLSIVFAGFIGGVRPALASAFIGWAYTAYLLSGSDFPKIAGINMGGLAVWSVVMPLTGWLVGRIRGRTGQPSAPEKAESPVLTHSRKLASMAEALRESEARFRTFVDHAADALFIQDTEDGGRVLDVNRQACESLGYTREEMLGCFPRDFDVGLPAQEVTRIGSRVASGETFAFETWHRRKDGSEF